MTNFFLRFLSSIFLLPIFIYTTYLGSYYFVSIILLIFFISTYEIIKNVKKLFSIIQLLTLLLFFSYCLYEIRGNTFNTFILTIWVFSIVWLSDIGGYFFGKIIGGKKLSIYSPKKTLAGFFGSIIMSQLAICILYFYFVNFSLNTKFFLIQIILSVISVFGDIFFSYIKRKNNIKDFSKIIPGHGGVLDRIDGLVFVTISFFIINKMNVL